MDKPKTQEEANENVIKHIKSLPKEEAKFIIYEGIKTLEKDGSNNALLLVSELKKHFVRH